VTQADRFEMDGGTHVQFNEGLPITGGPSIISTPTDLPARILTIPGGGGQVVLPSVQERQDRTAAFNHRTLLDRNRAEAERRATEIRMQEDSAARTLDRTGIPLPADLAKRFDMTPGRKVLPTQMDDLMRADTYSRSVTQPRARKVINTARVQGPDGKLMSVLTYEDGSQEFRPINGTVPARQGAAARSGGEAKPKAAAGRKMTSAEEADELLGVVLQGTRSASIDDAIKNVTQHFKSDPRFTAGKRAQVIQRLKKMKDAGEENPFYQAPAATAPAAGAPGAPAVGTVQKGYRFKGGNPADQNSWEKV
jgi:hypothetical protein